MDKKIHNKNSFSADDIRETELPDNFQKME